MIDLEDPRLDNFFAMDPPMSILNNVLIELDERAVLGRMMSPDSELYKYQLVAFGKDTIGVGVDMEDAKQLASGCMLNLLVEAGYPVPPPFGFDDEPGGAALDDNSTLLREFCYEKDLNFYFVLVYESDLDPRPYPYTISVTVANHGECRANASTRRQAKEEAARAMIGHLKMVYGEFTLESLRGLNNR